MFKAKGKDISNALARINKATSGGDSNEFVFIDVGKTSLWISNVYNGKGARVRVDCTADKPARIGISRLMLDAAMGNRGLMHFIPQDGSLDFAAAEGNYRGSMLTVPHQKIEVVTDDVRKVAQKETQSIKRLFGSVIEWVGIACVDGQTELNLSVRDNTGKMTAVVSDQIHLAYVTSSTPGKIKLDLPLGSALNISKLMEGDEEYSIALHENRLYTWNANIETSVPTVIEPGIPFEASAGLFASLKPTSIVELRPEDLKNAISNLMAIHEDSQEVTISVAEARGSPMLRLNSKTNYGKMSDSFAVAIQHGKPGKETVIQANMNLLQDAVRMTGSLQSVKLAFYGSKMFGLLVSDEKSGIEASYLCSAAMPKTAPPAA